MKTCQLGSTGIEVSRLGLGTVKFGRNQKVNYPEGFALPTDEAILNLLSIAQDLGINFLDTAPAYGSSEERLGHLLKGQRQEWILSSKVGEAFIEGESSYDYSKTSVIKSVERSLKRLNTDYLDILLVHSNGEDTKIIKETGIFDVLSQFKAEGKIRAFGMSTKTIEGGKLALDLSDLVMVTYNPAHTEEEAVIHHALKQQKGVLIKKGLASGHLNKLGGRDPLHEAFQFIFKEPGVHSVIVGTLNPDHLKQNVACAIDAT